MNITVWDNISKTAQEASVTSPSAVKTLEKGTVRVIEIETGGIVKEISAWRGLI